MFFLRVINHSTISCFFSSPCLLPCNLKIDTAGVGTIIVGLIKCSIESLFVGILQTLITVLVVGWVWSIWWGWDLMKVSKRTVQIPNDPVAPGGLLYVDAGHT